MPEAPTPFFSVIMATYDRGAHIEPSIASVLRQSFRDFELIVVEDGPSAANAPLAGADLGAVKWLSLPENTGSQSAPNNAGFAAARGAWIAYIGHDDVWSADHLARLAALTRSPQAPGVVVSGCIYHGPPGSEMFWVTGLFDDPDAPSRHFFPPSSFAVRRDVLAGVGGWRDPRAIAPPVDADLLLRINGAGARFASSGQITVHKFAAGHRYLSYLRQGSDEQRAMLAHPDLDRAEAWQGHVAEAKAAWRFMVMLYPDYEREPAGANFLANRSNKGIERLALRPLTGRVVLRQSGEPRALDWHGLEGDSMPRRWSGPNPKPKILIPYAYDGMARITLHVAGHSTPLKAVTVAVLGADRPPQHLETWRGDRLVVEAPLDPSNYTVLELHAPAVVRPATGGRTPDPRRLGIAIGDIEVMPVGRA